MSLNVLIVDDSETVRAVLAKVIHMCGLPIGALHVAEDGSKALEVLEKEWVDLMFLDINMPVMNGVELVQRMQGSGLLAKLPVVVVSTEGSVTRINELKQLGVRAYVRKPFRPEDIRTVVTELMGELDHG